MPVTENDLKDLLAERADIPTARGERVEEVRHRIRRRRSVRTVAGSGLAVGVLLLGVPVVAAQLDGKDSNGLSVAASPTPTPSAPVYRPGRIRHPTATKTHPTATKTRLLRPAIYTITPVGDGYRVRITSMGDLAGVRHDLRERGVRVVATPSPGFEECTEGGYSVPAVPTPGIWEFLVRPRQFNADRQLRLWNGSAYGELLFLHYCKVS